jgi:cyclopropane-fatty-acyl-phospholipid synthase
VSHSAIYTGTLRHRRYRELAREFSHPVSFVYLDLEELPSLAGGRLLRRWPGAWRFRRRDYLGPLSLPLEVAVRDAVEREIGERPAGPIRMLTQLRSFGMSFNPVTLYYCFAPDGEQLHSVLAEVTNTPWRERHSYVLGPWQTGRVLHATTAKLMHVSPFMPMDQEYRITLTAPGPTLSVHIDVQGSSGSDFDATLGLTASDLTSRTLSALIRNDPLAPLRTLRRIYIQGVTLKLRGVHVHPHPTTQSESMSNGSPPAPPADSSAVTPTGAQRAARWLGVALLKLTRIGTITIIDDGSVFHFGSGEPHATLTVRSPRFWTGLLRGSVGLADAYAAGWFETEDLVTMIRIGALNARRIDRPRRVVAPLRVPFQALREYSRPLTRERNQREISAHYDLGNDLFKLMLDPTLSYSCAVFETPQVSLEQAQLAKLERICQRLELSSGDHLLEIGTGWGGLAIYAAQTRGCRVTTATISVEQYRFARERVRQLGLDKLVDVIFCDYRDLPGRYDKLVSVEMVEAVGWRNFGRYLKKCSSLLTPEGLMLLQAITIDDRAYEVEKASKSFIKSYIFPGGCLPSLAVLTNKLAHRTDFQVAGIDDITAHYVETLRRWRANFDRAGAELTELGYDGRFQRIWRLYLAYCEAGFAERRILDLQLLLAKPRYRGTALVQRDSLGEGTDRANLDDLAIGSEP